MSAIEVYDEQESVIDLYLRGLSATKISKELSLQRKDVLSAIRQWHANVNTDNESKDVARDALNKMVEHYDRLIETMYKVVDEINEGINVDGKTPQWMNQKRATLDSIASLESKRVDLLQKAGLYERQELGDELAQMEEQKQAILQILRDHVCNNCRPVVMDEIGKISGRTEVTVVYDGEVVND